MQHLMMPMRASAIPKHSHGRNVVITIPCRAFARHHDPACALAAAHAPSTHVPEAAKSARAAALTTMAEQAWARRLQRAAAWLRCSTPPTDTE